MIRAKSILSFSLATILALVCLVAAGRQSALAQAPVNLKVGYFHLGMVKANYVLAQSAEILKAQAEAQLRQELESSNRKIQKMVDEKKGADEVKAAKESAEKALRAQQQALNKLVQSQEQQVKGRIQVAVLAVAKEKGLDVIVDGQGIYAGGQTFLDKGIDVTKEVISKLKGNRGNAQATSKSTPAEQATQSN